MALGDLKGDLCAVCGAILIRTTGASFYELTHTHSSPDAYLPTLHEYFCSEACLVKFVRERIEPDVKEDA